MRRRHRPQCGLAAAFGTPLFAALHAELLDAAADVLEKASATGQVSAAVLHVARRAGSFTRHFAKAASADAMFLLESISRPICVTALMTLFDRGEFSARRSVEKIYPKVYWRGSRPFHHAATADACVRLIHP